MRRDHFLCCSRPSGLQPSRQPALSSLQQPCDAPAAQQTLATVAPSSSPPLHYDTNGHANAAVPSPGELHLPPVRSFYYQAGVARLGQAVKCSVASVALRFHVVCISLYGIQLGDFMLMISAVQYGDIAHRSVVMAQGPEHALARASCRCQLVKFPHLGSNTGH